MYIEEDDMESLRDHLPQTSYEAGPLADTVEETALDALEAARFGDDEDEDVEISDPGEDDEDDEDEDEEGEDEEGEGEVGEGE